jgi:hypothetical protein
MPNLGGKCALVELPLNVVRSVLEIESVPYAMAAGPGFFFSVHHSSRQRNSTNFERIFSRYFEIVKHTFRYSPSTSPIETWSSLKKGSKKDPSGVRRWRPHT